MPLGDILPPSSSFIYFTLKEKSQVKVNPEHREWLFSKRLDGTPYLADCLDIYDCMQSKLYFINEGAQIMVCFKITAPLIAEGKHIISPSVHKYSCIWLK